MVLYTRTGLVQDCRHSVDGATSQDLLSLICSMSLEGGCLQGCWVGSTGNPQAHRTGEVQVLDVMAHLIGWVALQ